MSTKAEKRYRKNLTRLSSAEKNQIILECMRILDSPNSWDAGVIEQIAERFTMRGFIIRDCNDEHLFEASELK